MIALIDDDERSIIQEILYQNNVTGWLFNFMTSASLGDVASRRDRNWSYLFMCFLTRSSLKLTPGLKPGDIDVLILPCSRGRFFPSKAMALEIKIHRSRQLTRKRHPKPSGLEQAKGLLIDGFPYVGLLHVVLTEPSPRNEWKLLDLYEIVDDSGQVNFLRKELCDVSGTNTVERQFGRIKCRATSLGIGYNVTAIYCNDNKREIIGNSTLACYVYPVKNPKADQKLKRRIVRLAKAIQKSGRNIAPLMKNAA